MLNSISMFFNFHQNRKMIRILEFSAGMNSTKFHRNQFREVSSYMLLKICLFHLCSICEVPNLPSRRFGMFDPERMKERYAIYIIKGKGFQAHAEVMILFDFPPA